MFEHLPLEIVHEILCHLNVKDFLNLAATNHTLYECIHHSDIGVQLWRRVIQQHANGKHYLKKWLDASRIETNIENIKRIYWKILFENRLYSRGGCNVRDTNGRLGRPGPLQVYGSQIVSNATNGTISIWDFQSGSQRHRIAAHRTEITCIQVHDDLIVSGAFDGTIQMHNFHTADLIRFFSIDSSQLLVKIREKQSYLQKELEIDSNLHPQPELWQYQSTITALQFDNEIIVAGNVFGFIQIWDLATGLLRDCLEGHLLGITTIQFDRRLLVTGSADQTVRVWSLEHGTCLYVLPMMEFSRVLDLYNSGGSVRTVKLNDSMDEVDGAPIASTVHFDTEWLTVGCQNGLVLVWRWDELSSTDNNPIELTAEVANHQSWSIPMPRIFIGHTGPLQCGQIMAPRLTYDMKSKFMSAYKKGFTLATRATLGRRTQVIVKSINNTAQVAGKITFAPDSQQKQIWPAVDLSGGNARHCFISGSYDKSIRIWDMQRGSCIFVLRKHTAPIVSIQIIASETYTIDMNDNQLRVIPDSILPRAVSIARDGFMHTWDLLMGSCEKSDVTAQSSFLALVAFAQTP